MELLVITILSLLFFRLLLSTANKKAKIIPCKRHQWVTEEVVFDDGSKTYFMHCSICQMVPNTDTETTNYRETKR